MFRPVALDRGGLAGWGLSAALVCPLEGGGLAGRRLAGLGARVTLWAGLDAALEAVLRGEAGCDLLMVDCDHAGGMALAVQGYRRLRAAGICLPVMLVSSTCKEQIFPVRLAGPFHLRAPVSAVALQIGLELAFAPPVRD
ncbi:hypothetical protein G3572_15860 [Rhodobacter sp. ETT8]|uniref:Response regulator n=2 Tax=Pseudotabrizicola algicola TaxID=2709381 RepID=A0A6B3RX79_9RHOB|nr:hypothetical protein [Pseudotabrizicola algicola]